jgi:pyruvate ferredoxin oxidoreductase alpha subunit
VDKFLPSFKPKFPHMDSDDPKFLGTAAWPDYYEEFVFLRNKAMKISQEVIIETSRRYSKAIRPIIPLFSTYNLGPSEIVIVGIGSMMSTLEGIIDQLNESDSNSVGLIRLKCFRPFPTEELLSNLKSKSKIIVLDRAVSPSQGGPLFLEISSILQTSGENVDCFGFILGLGGREITLELGKRILILIESLDSRTSDSRQYWLDLNQNTIRRWTSNE